MSIPHPIPYQGSKRGLAKVILSLIPTNAEKIIEPFAGSSAISLVSAYYQKANGYFLNDINVPLMNLWKEIIENPESLAGKYEVLWKKQLGKEREYYDFVRNQFNETHRPDL
ncbi:MAG: DNA adenine methylase [Candidatus Omnitrophota bacterium]|jgi:DNA adenine methylase|nr:MAG: DNA adenine methylase [Candidatus Omnitrophota bacterium]